MTSAAAPLPHIAHWGGLLRNALCVLGITALPLTALAQNSVVERCREAASDAARIACLEAALKNKGDTPSSESSAEPEPVAPTDAASGDSRPSGANEDPSDIGAEQVKARNQTSADLQAAHGLRVAAYTTVPFRRLQIELENGQVWRQIEGDTQRIRVDLDRNQTIDIEESGLGGYKLRLNEMRRTIRVERIR